ncbi:hypothetical protein Droror1_Dr00026889 [Drosera rotundifolia]
MYGQRNYAPQLASTPHRPIPLPQQQHGGFAQPPFRQLPPLQSLPLVQQPGLPHAVQSGPTAQLHALSIPPPIPRHGRSGLMPNPGQYHLHQNPMAHGSRPMLDAYPSSLQTAMRPSHTGTQNVPWAPPPARPLLSLFGPSRAPPPPSSQPQQMSRHPVFPTPPPPPPQFTPLPPVPPTGSGLFRSVGGVWTSPSMTEKSSTQPLPSSPPPPPPSSPPHPSPPPPPPSPPSSSFSPSGAFSLAPSNAAAHEALLPDTSINSCQTTQPDGFDTTDVMLQADDSRDYTGLSIKGSWVHDKSASQNSPSDLLPTPPKSCDAKNSGNMSSIKHEEENYPSVDSDIDMEDDITQFDKDQMGFYSGNKLELVMQDAVQSSRDDHVEGKRAPTVDSKDDAVTKSEESPDPVLRASPFRLIQSYASDDSLDEDNDDAPHREFNPTTASETYKEGAANSHGDVVHGSPKSEFPEINLEKFESSKDCRSTAPQNEANELAGVNAKAEALSDTSSGSFQQINTLSKASFNVVYDGVKVLKEDVRKATVKVDEFGRLVREDISESESDDSDKSRRRSRRHRSRSRSESPPYRRRRRTPLRREMRRSRSRSWSPRKRRMSRSPSRHGTVVEADWQRRGGAKIGQCFNFLKGRCYRGASCRYLHQDLDQHDGSGHSRSRQQYSEVPQRSRNSNSDKEDEDIKVRPSLEEDEVEAHDKLAHDDMLSHELSASQNTNVREERKTDLEMNEIPHSGVSQDDTANIYCVEKTENLEGANSGLFSQPLIQEAPGDPVSLPVEDVKHRKTSVASVEDEAVQHASADLSVPEHNLVDRMDSSADSFSAVSQTSAASSSQLPVGEPYLSKITNEVGSQENPVSSGCASMDLKHHAPQLPFPPPQQTSHGVDASQSLHTLGAHNSVSVVVSPLQPSPVKRDPHQSHASNQRLYPVPVNQMWSARLPYIVDPTTSSVPLHFQQGHLSVRDEIVKHTSTEPPGHLEVTGSQHHAYSSLQDPLLPPLHVAELHNKPLQPSGAPNQQLGGTSLWWDDRYGHMPSRDTVSSSLFPPGSSTLQPSKLHEELSSRTLQPFASRDHLLYQHQPSLGLQQATLDKLSSYIGGSSTSSSVPADPLYRNHQSILSDLGGSRIIAHYNPYASTFEKPLNLKFSFKTERDSYIRKHDVPFAPVPLSVEGQRMSNLELEHIVSSPNAYPATGQASRKSGDQYDPFEPGSESSKKHALNYDSMFKLSGSHEPLATQENKRVKEDGDIAASLSIENDEFGETADAEAGAVENGSTSHPNDEANASAGENEIDQVRSMGKSKKNKDSRGMKLFQAELANFVKEVLKPSWRQGNMSKEAFKTIVKKTVEKVSGAMKNHRVPKSKENISRYIDSSHRKLTRLVQGYVSKYAKA